MREAVKNIAFYIQQDIQKHFFVGFNALTKCEEILIQELISEGKAELLTSVALLNTLTGYTQAQTVSTLIQFKALSRPGIEFYLDTDKPYDCCGSVRVEGLGITLLKSIRSEDPTAVMGLPMIALVSMLEKEGLDPLMIGSPTTMSEFDASN